MPQLRFFCLQIFCVVRIGFAAYRHLLHHFQAVTFKSDHLLRIVGQKTELPNAEIEKDLRAESVIAQIGREPEPRICFHRIEPLFLQLVSMNFRREPDTASFLPHVNENAVPFVGDLAQRRGQGGADDVRYRLARP